MFGLGKYRTKFGKWLDHIGVNQDDIAKHSRVSTATISRMCSERGYAPKYATFSKINKYLRKLGYDAEYDDFWD